MDRHAPPLRRPSRLRRAGMQAGSVMVTAAIALSLLVITLAGTEIGHLFFLKREFQKTADLAALAGAQLIRGSCASASNAALSNANGAGDSDTRRNMPVGFELSAGDVHCGPWSRSGTTAPGDPDNAVTVTFTRTPPALMPFLGITQPITVTATAALVDPYAVFSVGSKLVEVNGVSTLGRMLKGIGLDLDSSAVAGYEGLAGVKVTPGGLLKALNIPVASDVTVGDLNALLAAQNIELGQLLNAIVTAGGHDELLGSNVQLLGAISSKLGISGLSAVLGSFTTPATGLFAQIISAGSDAGSALDVGVGAFELIQAAVGVATKNHFAEVNPPLTLLGGTVTARTALIEPPSIAMGGVGAKAYTAQLRTYVKFDTANTPIIGGLVRLNLPIMIDAISGTGTLAEMCTPALKDASGKDHARINVDASVFKVCIGKPGLNVADEPTVFATSASCETNLQPDLLLNTKIASLNLLSLNAKLQVDGLPVQDSVTLAESETQTVGNDLLAGTTVRDLTQGLLAALMGDNLATSPAMTTAQINQMASDLFGTPACTTSACRQARMNAANAKITGSTNQLGGLTGTLTTGALNVTDQLLADLGSANLLGGIGNLVTGLLNTVTSALGGILNILGPLNPAQLLDGCVGLLGSDNGCRAELANSIKNSSSAGGHTVTNAVTALTGFALQLLQPLLDGIGTQLLTPILRNTLGLQLGQVDVHLQTLQCEAVPQLVY